MTSDRIDLDIDLVIPTVGRTSLRGLLSALAGGTTAPRRIIVVDDRTDTSGALLDEELPSPDGTRLEVVRSGGGGPAAARNAGWRTATAEWVAFLDDDVHPPADWFERLQRDLAALPPEVAASQGRIRVPLPADRSPTDWERNVAGLEQAQWATADMAYRRAVLDEVGGFDERFPRAYREDADLGLRVTDAGYRIVRGGRVMVHPVRPAEATVSLRMQRGNTDDPLMRALHGRGWRRRAGVPAGRRPWHLATTAALMTAILGGVTGRRGVAAFATGTWAALTADFAWRRIAPGPGTRGEIRRMATTSMVLPLLATWHWLRGWATLPLRLRRPGPRPTTATDQDAPGADDSPDAGVTEPGRPLAVLFDRDGTLVHDVPYNGDPDAVRPVDGAAAAVARLRGAGIKVGVVSNQSGIGRGMLTRDQVDAVNDRIDELVGPIDAWHWCPHAPDDGCACRKPAPGLIERAAADLGVDARDCVVIGDIGSDVDAAHAAGARAVMVPTDATRAEEILAAPVVANSLTEAIERILAGSVAPTSSHAPVAAGRSPA